MRLTTSRPTAGPHPIPGQASAYCSRPTSRVPLPLRLFAIEGLEGIYEVRATWSPSVMGRLTRPISLTEP